VNNQEIDVPDEINYLEVTFESGDGWNRQKLKATEKGNHTLVAINQCLARIQDVRVKILENVHEMLS
jgi:hypothetical protein